MRGRADYWAPGDWNAVCWECGRKFKASQLIKHWQGYYVCKEHWEPRHPQDFVRGVPDQPTPPWSQPMPADSFVTICSLTGRSGVAGLAVGGCWIVGFVPQGLYEDVSTYVA